MGIALDFYSSLVRRIVLVNHGGNPSGLGELKLRLVDIV